MHKHAHVDYVLNGDHIATWRHSKGDAWRHYSIAQHRDTLAQTIDCVDTIIQVLMSVEHCMWSKEEATTPFKRGCLMRPEYMDVLA